MNSAKQEALSFYRQTVRAYHDALRRGVPRRPLEQTIKNMQVAHLAWMRAG